MELHLYMNRLSCGEVSDQELSPLFNNLLDIKSLSPCRVYDFVVPFLMALERVSSSFFFQVSGVFLVGSSLTDVLALPLGCNDIDMKVIIRGSHHIAARYFSFIERQSFFFTEGGSKSLVDLVDYSLKQVYIPDLYSSRGYVIKQASSEHVPFEISLLISEQLELPPSVMNSDSLYIPLKVFYSSFEPPSLGSIAPKVFLGYSTEGDYYSVVNDIKNHQLTCRNPEGVNQVGWPRFMMALTSGFVSLDPSMNEVFQKKCMENPPEAIYEIHQFIQKKKRQTFSIFWISFVSNAIFHSLKAKSLEKWSEQFISLLGHPNKNVAWMQFLGELLTPPFPREELPALLAILSPLFAKSVVNVNHQGGVWLQCKMEEAGEVSYLLVPPPHSICPEKLQKAASLFFYKNHPIPSCRDVEEKIVLSEAAPHFFLTLSDVEESPLAKEILSRWISLSPSSFRDSIEQMLREGQGERAAVLLQNSGILASADKLTDFFASMTESLLKNSLNSHILAIVDSNLMMPTREKADLLHAVKILEQIFNMSWDAPLLSLKGFETLSKLLERVRVEPACLTKKVLKPLFRSAGRAAKGLDRNQSDFEDLVNFIIFLTERCSSYGGVTSEPIAEELLFEAIACILSFKDRALINHALTKILIELTRENILFGKFFHKLTKKLAEVYATSTSEAYRILFSNDYCMGPMGWKIFLDLLIDPEATGSWMVYEIDKFLPVFIRVLEQQFALESFIQSPRGGLLFYPILDLYLKLLEKGTEVHLPIGLMTDVILSSEYYFSSGVYKDNVLGFLRVISSIKKTRPYAEEDILKGKDKNLQELYKKFFKESLSKKEVRENISLISSLKK